MLAEAPSGELVDLSDLSDDERVLSPSVIRSLCVGPEGKGVDPRGIRVKGARVLDPLDLSFCTVPHPLRFEATTFAATPDLTAARMPALWIEDSSLPGLLAEGLRLDHDLRLEASEIGGEVRLRGTKLGGLLVCSGTTITNKGANALFADEAEMGGMFLSDGFSAAGEIRLLGAKIAGQLRCSDARLVNEGKDALSADTAEIDEGVYLGKGFSATGAVRFLGARLAALSCGGATLTNEGGAALEADFAEIRGNVVLGDGFRATGEVSLLGARIGGQLNCKGGRLTNKGGNALTADGAEIKVGVFLGNGFTANGKVRLLGARIGGQLDCSGGTVTNEGDAALTAEGAVINGNVFLGDGFSATGEVRLPGARIDGQLACWDATLVCSSGSALTARDATIGGTLLFRNVRITGGVDLFRASATTLHDDIDRANRPLGSWQGVEPLVLNSFTYAQFGHEAEWDAKLRHRWLEQTDGFQIGAWQQLIDVYRAQGRDEEAIRTAIAMHNDRVRRAGLPWYRRAGRRVLWVVVGHGYRPWLAGIWATAMIVAFALVVWGWAGMLVPVKEGDTGSAQPVAYAADVFLPFIDFDQADRWTPTGWLRWVGWSVILLGWSLSTIFVAGFTRIVRSP